MAEDKNEFSKYFLMQQLNEIKESNKELYQYLRDHIEREEDERKELMNRIGSIEISVARLEETTKGLTNKWGFVATVVTATVVGFVTNFFRMR